MRKSLFYFLCINAGLHPALMAGELSIPNSPLFSETEPPANVMFIMDDSGSMDWEVMVKPHYEYCNYDYDTRYWNCANSLRDNGIFYYSQKYYHPWWGRYVLSRPIYYLFEFNNAYNFYSTRDFPQTVTTDWRIYDSDFNGMAYNPNTNYFPWIGPCEGSGSNQTPYRLCESARFDQAHSHPHLDHPHHGNTVNLGNDNSGPAQYIHSYVVSIDDKGFSGNRPNHNNITLTGNEMIDPWDSHLLFQFTSNGQITVAQKATNNLAQPFTIATANLSGASCYNALGSKPLVQAIVNGSAALTGTDEPGCRTIAQAQENYANWFEYYRRRAFTAKASVSYVISKFPALYYGLNYINSRQMATPITVNSSDLAADNNNLLNEFFEKRQESIGTPLIYALDNVGQYYGDQQQSPIISACQRNFSILLTDGFWNDASNIRPRRGDVDGDGYGGNRSTLSDIAYYYYTNDIRNDLPNRVAPTANNPNEHQHMVTLGVVFGLSSSLSDTDGDGWPNPPLNINSDWGNPDCGTDCPAKINDLWHAAFNSRGMFLSASNFEDLESGLSQALDGIFTEMQGTLSSPAANSSMLVQDSSIFQAQFRKSDWSGDLVSYDINLQGVIDVLQPKWRAANLLNAKAPNDRVILTYGNRRGVAFRWPNDYTNPNNREITATQANLLLADVTTDRQNAGQTIIDYLRGERTEEHRNGGNFRSRGSVLGDIVHSGAVYVSPPQSRFTDPFYARFKTQYQNRTPMVFIGANDGMLHGFNAITGEELLAYVPGNASIWSALPDLTKRPYNHRYFVDATPTVGEYMTRRRAYRTILASGMGAGGQGIFALNITEGQFSESRADAEDTVLFEFTDADDPDVGYIFGSPQIVRMNNGQWAIIFGNGYNSTKNTYPSGAIDQHTATGGQAALFILFINRGTDGRWRANRDYIKIPVGDANQNGLSEPFPVDIDGNFTVDYLYAGDLNGDLWKFDVTHRNANRWRRAENVSKLFSAGPDQPIVQAPVVGAHPTGLSQGLLVYIGTGKYIEASDTNPNNQPTQSFYGIWDKNESTPTTLSGTQTLLNQQILSEANGFRAVSNHSINWNNHNGWYLNLTQGEKIFGKPILRNGRIIFNTIIPTGHTEAACQGDQATSWLMELDAYSGSRLNIPPFDINGDYYFNTGDYITFDETVNGEQVTTSAPPGGIQSTVGATAAPTVITSQDGKTEIKVLNGTGGLGTITENPGPNHHGRQNWQEVN